MEDRRPLARLAFWYDATVHSYSQVLLSARPFMGWVAAAATCMVPSMALAGLLSVCVANGAAWLLRFNRDAIRSGYYGYNALLVGLALSYFYTINGSLLVLFVVGSLLSLFLTIGLTSVMSAYLHVPIFSLPFVIATPLLYAAAVTAAGLSPDSKSMAVLLPWLSLDQTPLVEGFLRSLGSILFLPHLGAGLLLLAGLVVVSRILSFCAVLGYVTGLAVCAMIGAELSAMTVGMTGFNAMLTAMVLGGFLVIPSPSAYGLAVMGAALCTVTGLALEGLLAKVNLTALTIPFIMTTLVVLYALKFREIGSGPQLVTFLPGTPEENLDYADTRVKRFGSYGPTRFSLPFYGEWTVSQGVEGPYTHKGLWGFAWDFVVADEEGRDCHHTGDQLRHYYAYRLPVLAPADGTVVQVVDWVPDNEIGIINARENWGNTVIIRHAPALYSVLAHLAPGSIRARIGHYVRRGDLIGLCGNSGRSVEPHLHFHVQESPDLTSRTLCPFFTRYIRGGTDGCAAEVVQQAIPLQRERVRNMQVGEFLGRALKFPIGRRLSFRVRTPERTREEQWTISVDFNGTTFIESAPSGACAWFWIGEGALTTLNYAGRSDTALFALAVGAPLVPLTVDHRLQWEDVLPCRYFIRGPSRVAVDILRPFLDLVRVRSRLRFAPFEKRKVDGLLLETCVVAGSITVEAAVGGRTTGTWTSSVALERTWGPVYLRLDSPNGWWLEAEALLANCPAPG